MPASRRLKDLAQYPAQFFTILTKCGLEGEALGIPVPGYREAKKLSGLWYNFRGNLMARRDALQALERPLTGEEEAIIERAKLTARVTLIIEPSLAEARRMTWMNREHSWQDRALAALAPVAAPYSPPPSPVEDSLRRLLEEQEAIDTAERRDDTAPADPAIGDKP